MTQLNEIWHLLQPHLLALVISAEKKPTTLFTGLPNTNTLLQNKHGVAKYKHIDKKIRF
jgi:hypothetical protein